MSSSTFAALFRSVILLAAGVCCAGTSPSPVPATPFRVIAHRGASAYAPENTLPAFQIAADLGCPEVELDVQLSRDGEVVLFHDRTLDEKTDLQGATRDHDLAVLRRAEIGSWFDRTHLEVERSYAGTSLIALADLFNTFGRRFHYHVEIKGEDPALPERILSVVAAHALRDRVTVTSFSFRQLERLRALDSTLRIGLLIDRVANLGPRGAGSPEPQRREIDRARKASFSQVAVRAAELTPELVSHAVAAGLEIRAWGVKSPGDMEHVIRAGANGMTVDWPDRLLARLTALGG